MPRGGCSKEEIVKREWLLETLGQRDEQEQQHDAHQTNDDAQHHLAEHHRQAHTNTQQQRAQNRQRHSAQRLAGDLDGGLALPALSDEDAARICAQARRQYEFDLEIQ